MNEICFLEEIKKNLEEYIIEDFRSIDSLLSSEETKKTLINSEKNHSLFNDELKIKQVNSQLRKLFKQNLLETRESKCEFPDCNITMQNILIASHIWAVNKIVSNDELDEQEKIFAIKDPNNGFLFCPTHDFLFDKYLISFDKNGKIVKTKTINKFSNQFNLNTESKIKLNKENKKYLAYHRQLCKNKNKI